MCICQRKETADILFHCLQHHVHPQKLLILFLSDLELLKCTESRDYLNASKIR